MSLPGAFFWFTGLCGIIFNADKSNIEQTSRHIVLGAERHRKKDRMRRLEWRGAIWLWGLVALLLSAELYPAVMGGRRVQRDSAVRDAIYRDAEFGDIVPGDAVPEGIMPEENSKKDTPKSSQKEAALTFDDGPHSLYTPQLLDGLKKRGVKASFFLIGQNIDGNEDIIRRMKEEGHLIGNHSQSHMQLTKENAELACRQINSTNQKIYEITGEMPSYIRPPYGSWNEELECMVPMTVTLWDVDPLDWKTQDKGKIVSHVKKHVEDGSIILLHDVYGTSVDAALEIVDTLSREGYNFVTVDELLID